MITIKIYDIAKCPQDAEDFLKSLKAHASDKNAFEVTDKPSNKSEVIITIPNNCLVLGHSWDKYIRHALDNKLTIDKELIVKRFNLISRSEGFDGLDVKMKCGLISRILRKVA